MLKQNLQLELSVLQCDICHGLPMTIQESTFHSKVINAEIYRVSAFPDKNTASKGVVIVLHGLGDHTGCHREAMEIFCKFGYRAEGFDWPGNGRSAGNRGDIPGVRNAIQLLQEFIDDIDEPPVAIYAHSTGAFLALPFLTRHGKDLPLKWLWLSSPLLRPGHNQSKAKMFMADILADWVPELSIPTGVKPSRCYQVNDFNPVAISKQFKYRHSLISARFGRDLLDWENKVNWAAKQLEDPLSVLVTQGNKDRICPAEFAQEMFRSIPATKKTFLLLDGLRHEPFREPDNKSFLESITEWLDSVS